MYNYYLCCTGRHIDLVVQCACQICTHNFYSPQKSLLLLIMHIRNIAVAQMENCAHNDLICFFQHNNGLYVGFSNIASGLFQILFVAAAYAKTNQILHACKAAVSRKKCTDNWPVISRSGRHSAGYIISTCALFVINYNNRKFILLIIVQIRNVLPLTTGLMFTKHLPHSCVSHNFLRQMRISFGQQ